MWQLMGERYKERVNVFERALRALSPPEGAPLRLGQPVRIDGDSREIPTVKMSYGEVPFIYLSAGIQKAISLAYILVWAFFDLMEKKGYHREDGQNKLVILVDEIEAHLHPKWQRKILPALLAALKDIVPASSFQAHIATHSPLVMASLETEYDYDADRIHVLSFHERDVTLESYPFVKQGTVNDWLESDVFGLGAARSKPGEEVLELAKDIQSDRTAKMDQVQRIDKELHNVLPDDDPFWVRWNRYLELRRNG
ncbi:hypothetical protein X760_07805 [Mesorhizobium sp. LSHC422A00]|uniref:AAA family ATPase n=1 Tax=Mesorhizobium sp. LSHC422A00 TaxID=1287294 RepID=UPI0003CEC510|nr:hypothetical protein X760_07805 [Mesorhizobium sp. LSHC422A00]